MTSKDFFRAQNYYKWVEGELSKITDVSITMNLLHYVIGMAEESSEILKRITELPTHKQVSKDENIMEEFGDMLWYMTAYHITQGRGIESYFDMLHNRLSDNPKFFEPYLLVCIHSKMLGLYKKDLFLGKDINPNEMIELETESLTKFFSMAGYLDFNIIDVMENNYEKLTGRYPNGRTSHYAIEMKPNKVKLQ